MLSPDIPARHRRGRASARGYARRREVQTRSAASDLDLAPGATSEDAVLMTGARARDAPVDRVVPVGTLRFCSPDLPRPPPLRS